MSAYHGSSNSGGRIRMSTRVYLNVYDLSPANQYLFRIGLGLHHSGVEILGVEYSFANGGSGIFEHAPKAAPDHAIFREQIDMGTYDGGQDELNRALDDLRDHFGPTDYHLIRKNCNAFANALCWKLLHKTIPGHVNRLADIGVCCSCLLPRQWLEQAPVGDPNAKPFSGSGGASGFLVRAPSNRIASTGSSVSSSTGSTFSGHGMKLGSTPASSSSATSPNSFWNKGNTSPRQDDLTDRREKARKAALARLERAEQEKKGFL